MAGISCHLNIPFPNSREAEIAYNSLRIDKGPKKSCVKTEFSVKEAVLHVDFTTKEARMLRVSVNGFLDHLLLVLRTIHEFG